MARLQSHIRCIPGIRRDGAFGRPGDHGPHHGDGRSDEAREGERAGSREALPKGPEMLREMERPRVFRMLPRGHELALLRPEVREAGEQIQAVHGGEAVQDRGGQAQRREDIHKHKGEGPGRHGGTALAGQSLRGQDEIRHRHQPDGGRDEEGD